MNEATTYLEQIEISLEKAREKVEMAETLKRLSTNNDFKSIFVDNYFKDYAIKLVELKANPGMQSEPNQKYIDNQINAIGYIKHFMNSIYTEGYNAARSIEADEAEREVILQEAL